MERREPMKTTAEKKLPLEKSKHVDPKLLDEVKDLSDKLESLGIDPRPGYRIEPALGGHLLRSHVAFGPRGSAPK